VADRAHGISNTCAPPTVHHLVGAVPFTHGFLRPVEPATPQAIASASCEVRRAMRPRRSRGRAIPARRDPSTSPTRLFGYSKTTRPRTAFGSIQMVDMRMDRVAQHPRPCLRFSDLSAMAPERRPEVSPELYAMRVKRKWSPERAANTPPIGDKSPQKSQRTVNAQTRTPHSSSHLLAFAEGVLA
jgi:hypothetical protein